MTKGTPLSNTRRERFAQELATGKTATEAMKDAGYGDRRNSTRLKKDAKVAARVAQLQAAAAIRTEITIQSLTDMLLADRELARSLGQASAAKTCVDSLAKLHGLFVDKQEVGSPGDFDRMTDKELDDFIRAGLEEYGGGIRPAKRRRG